MRRTEKPKRMPERMTEGDREAEVNSNNLGGMGSSSAGSTSSSLGVQLPDFGKFGTSPWEPKKYSGGKYQEIFLGRQSQKLWDVTSE